MDGRAGDPGDASGHACSRRSRAEEDLNDADDRQHLPQIRLQEPADQLPGSPRSSTRTHFLTSRSSPAYITSEIKHQGQAADDEVAISRGRAQLGEAAAARVRRYEKPAANMKLGMIVSA